MKKGIIFAAIAIAVVMTLCACGKKTEQPATTSQPGEEVSEESPDPLQEASVDDSQPDTSSTESLPDDPYESVSTVDVSTPDESNTPDDPDTSEPVEASQPTDPSETVEVTDEQRKQIADFINKADTACFINNGNIRQIYTGSKTWIKGATKNTSFEYVLLHDATKAYVLIDDDMYVFPETSLTAAQLKAYANSKTDGVRDLFRGFEYKTAVPTKTDKNGLESYFIDENHGVIVTYSKGAIVYLTCVNSDGSSYELSLKEKAGYDVPPAVNDEALPLEDSEELRNIAEVYGLPRNMFDDILN